MSWPVWEWKCWSRIRSLTERIMDSNAVSSAVHSITTRNKIKAKAWRLPWRATR